MRIDLYFDYLSVFGYLAYGRLLDTAKRHGATIVYHPCDIKQLRLNAGNTGPSNSQIPAKLAYMARDARRWADLYGLKVQERPAGWATEVYNKGTYLAVERDEIERYAAEAWACVWRDGVDCGTTEGERELEQRMGWDEGTLAAYAGRPDVDARYAEEIAAASARGVFGVPTMTIGDEMWWGNDRIYFIERYLKQHA